MSQKKIVTVELTDDLDGSQGSQTVQFGWQGKNWEIDLSEGHANEITTVLDRFSKAAREASKTAPDKKPPRSGIGREKSALVREWAAQAGVKMSARGRIAATVLAQYEAAQAEAKSAKARAKGGSQGSQAAPAHAGSPAASKPASVPVAG